jgi:hypothetical protein
MVWIQPPFAQPAKPEQARRLPLDLCCAECCGPAVRSYRIEPLPGWEEERHVENLRRHATGDRSIRRNGAGAGGGCSSPQASRGVRGRHDQGHLRMRRQRPLAGLQGRAMVPQFRRRLPRISGRTRTLVRAAGGPISRTKAQSGRPRGRSLCRLRLSRRGVPIADRLAFPLPHLGRRRLGDASSGGVEPLPSLVVI